MLDILRKKASSLIVKVLLGGIAIVFIFFFGSSSMRNPELQGETVANVNGRNITSRELTGRLQMNRDSNPHYSTLPESFQAQMRRAAIGELVQGALIEGEANKLGLTVTNEEVADVIRQDPNLSKDGKFDSSFYQKQFRPGYENRYGIDYEDAVRKSLLVQKLKNLFIGAVQVSDEGLKNYYALQNTRLSFQKIELSPDQASGFWPLFQNGKLTESALKEAGLKQEEVPITPIAKVDGLFPGASAEALGRVMGLTAQKPIPEAAVQTEGKVYFVKLLKREEPDWAAFEKNKVEERESFREELAQSFFAKWYEERARQAKIKIE